MTDETKSEKSEEMSQEVKDLNVDKEEVKVIYNKEVDALADEFIEFLGDKSEIIPDTGIKKTLPTGIDLLDAILGGGFAVGALNIIVGQPGSGKSMIACQTIGACQKELDGDILSVYLDSEESTTSTRLANLGATHPKIRPYNDVTVEKVFKIVEGMSLFKAKKKILDKPSIIVWDSIANTLTQKERDTEDINSVIGFKARMLSILIPKYVAQMAQNNICMIAVNQLRDVLNLGQFAAPKDLKFMSHNKDMPGGTVLKFNAFQLLEIKMKKAVDPDKWGFEGIVVKIKCVKNKLFRPNVEIELMGNFNTGFSNFWTNYRFLRDNKALQSGAWNYLISMPDKKFRTKDILKLYNEDEDFKTQFDIDVKKLINSEIIERYGYVKNEDGSL